MINKKNQYKKDLGTNFSIYFESVIISFIISHICFMEIVSKTYREAIEAYYDGTFTKKKVGKWVTELKKVYNRGFTPGFYFKRMTEEDHQHKSPSNLSHYRYIKVGQIEGYNTNTGFASLSLDNGYLNINDDIIIMGKTTNTYIHQKVKKNEV